MLPERHDNSFELLRRVRESVGPAKADRWFGSQTAIRIDGDTVVVRAATTYLLKFVQSKHADLIAETAADLLGQEPKLTWVVDESLAADAAATKNAAASGSTPEPKQPKASSLSGDLERFVVGDCNSVSFNAAKLLSQQPTGVTGVMVLFGPIGCGKSHLLEGVASTVRLARTARVMSINGPKFGNLFKQAMSEYATAGFRQRFNSVDLLCIDDLDFFESKKAFQDELLQTIDRIESRGGTVLLTSSVHPKMLTGLTDALISRLMAGPVCRIETPSPTVRLAVAKQRAAQLQADISSKAISYVANRFTGSMREVIGAITTLHAHSLADGKRIKLSVARSVLASLERDVAKVVRLADIEAAVASLFGVPPTEMRSARRSRSVSQPRQVAMYLARKLTSGAYKEIGEYFGGRNHSTVMAAERSVNKMIANHDQLKIGFQKMPVEEVVLRLEDQLRAG